MGDHGQVIFGLAEFSMVMKDCVQHHKMKHVTFISVIDPWRALAIATGAVCAGSALVLGICSLHFDHSSIMNFSPFGSMQ